MSATRDQGQKIAFVYSNLYKLYQKGKTEATEANVNAPQEEAKTETHAEMVAPVAVIQKPLATSSNVLKADDLHKAEKPAAKVSNYNPTEFIGKRVARPAAIAKSNAPREAISSLKDNLKSLNDLHSRLRFMLQELEDLVKE